MPNDPYASKNGKQTKKSTSKQMIPSVSLDTDDSIAGMVNGNIPTISMGSPEDEQPRTTAKERVTMPTSGPKSSKTNKTRKVADISEMATKKTKEEHDPTDIKESIQAEVFAEGGPFDKYVENKKEEYYERMKLEDEKEILENYKAEDGTSAEELVDVENETIDDEEAEILAEQKKSKNDNYKVNSVVHKDEEDTEEVEEVEEEVEDIDDYLNDVDDEVEEASDSEPVPFYTGTGYKDDYEYPEEYDLPEDEEDDEIVDEEPSDEELDDGATEEELVEEDEEIEEELVEEVEEKVEAAAPVAEPEKPEKEQTEFREYEKIGSKRIAFTTDESDLDALEKEIDNDSGLPTEDERLEELKVEIAQKIKPKARSLDLSGFTIATKSTASNKILEMKETSAGKWVLPTTGITYQIREISGQKIEYLRENASSNTPTAARNVLKTIYDHIITPKPASFEQWTKTIAYADYDHLYMGIYLAAFSGANYMPMTCVMEQGKVAKKETGCGKMFLTDNLDIMDLVKFKDKESEKKFWDLYDSDRTNSEGLYASEIIPVSNSFAIAFCEPTLYSVMIENTSYGRDFTDKYETIIAFMPYISEIYWIDHARNKLVPIDYQKYENNASKTAKSKVIRYSNIFDSFTTDEYSSVVSLINGISESNDWFTYRIPEVTCPECGRLIEEEEIGASGLVFTRHRLGILASTSTK